MPTVFEPAFRKTIYSKAIPAAPCAGVTEVDGASTAFSERGLMREVENFRSQPPAVMFAWKNA